MQRAGAPGSAPHTPAAPPHAHRVSRHAAILSSPSTASTRSTAGEDGSDRAVSNHASSSPRSAASAPSASSAPAAHEGSSFLSEAMLMQLSSSLDSTATAAGGSARWSASLDTLARGRIGNDGQPWTRQRSSPHAPHLLLRPTQPSPSLPPSSPSREVLPAARTDAASQHSLPSVPSWRQREGTQPRHSSSPRSARSHSLVLVAQPPHASVALSAEEEQPWSATAGAATAAATGARAPRHHRHPSIIGSASSTAASSASSVVVTLPPPPQQQQQQSQTSRGRRHGRSGSAASSNSGSTPSTTPVAAHPRVPARRPVLGWRQPYRLHAVAALPGGRLCTGGAPSGAVEVWDSRTGRREGTLEGHQGAVLCLATFYSVMASGGGGSSSGGGGGGGGGGGAVAPLLLSGAVDGTARLWDLRTLHNIAVLEGHTGFVTAVSWCRPAGGEPALAFTASDDGTVRLWRALSGQCLAVLRGHEAPINALLCAHMRSSGGGGLGLYAGGDTGDCTGELSGAAGSYATYVISADDDGIVKTWAVSATPAAAASHRCVNSFDARAGGRAGEARGGTDDGSAASNHRRSVVWDVAMVHLGARLSGGEAESLEPPLAAACDDGFVRLWRYWAQPSRTAVWAVLQTPLLTQPRRLLAYHRFLFVGGAQGDVVLWECGDDEGSMEERADAAPVAAVMPRTPPSRGGHAGVTSASATRGVKGDWQRPPVPESHATLRATFMLHSNSISGLSLQNNTLTTVSFDHIVATWDATDLLGFHRQSTVPYPPALSVSEGAAGMHAQAAVAAHAAEGSEDSEGDDDDDDENDKATDQTAGGATDYAADSEKQQQQQELQLQDSAESAASHISPAAAARRYPELPVSFVLAYLQRCTVSTQQVLTWVLLGAFAVCYLAAFVWLFADHNGGINGPNVFAPPPYTVGRPQSAVYALTALESHLANRPLRSTMRLPRTFLSVSSAAAFAEWASGLVEFLWMDRVEREEAVAAPAPGSDADSSAAPTSAPYPFLSGGNVLLSTLRIRARRVSNHSCHWNNELLPRGVAAPPCYAQWRGSRHEDTAPLLCPASARCSTVNRTASAVLGLSNDGFLHRARDAGPSFSGPIKGHYNTGGYAVDLYFSDSATAAADQLFALSQLGFVDDVSTRLVDVSLYAYNVYLDVFLFVHLICEVPEAGAWLPSVQSRAFEVYNADTMASRMGLLMFLFVADLGLLALWLVKLVEGCRAPQRRLGGLPAQVSPRSMTKTTAATPTTTRDAAAAAAVPAEASADAAPRHTDEPTVELTRVVRAVCSFDSLVSCAHGIIFLIACCYFFRWIAVSQGFSVAQTIERTAAANRNALLRENTRDVAQLHRIRAAYVTFLRLAGASAFPLALRLVAQFVDVSYPRLFIATAQRAWRSLLVLCVIFLGVLGVCLAQLVHLLYGTALISARTLRASAYDAVLRSLAGWPINVEGGEAASASARSPRYDQKIGTALLLVVLLRTFFLLVFAALLFAVAFNGYAAASASVAVVPLRMAIIKLVHDIRSQVRWKSLVRRWQHYRRARAREARRQTVTGPTRRVSEGPRDLRSATVAAGEEGGSGTSASAPRAVASLSAKQMSSSADISADGDKGDDDDASGVVGSVGSAPGAVCRATSSLSMPATTAAHRASSPAPGQPATPGTNVAQDEGATVGGLLVERSVVQALRRQLSRLETESSSQAALDGGGPGVDFLRSPTIFDDSASSSTASSASSSRSSSMGSATRATTAAAARRPPLRAMRQRRLGERRGHTAATVLRQSDLLLMLPEESRVECRPEVERLWADMAWSYHYESAAAPVMDALHRRDARAHITGSRAATAAAASPDGVTASTDGVGVYPGSGGGTAARGAGPLAGSGGATRGQEAAITTEVRLALRLRLHSALRAAERVERQLDGAEARVRPLQSFTEMVLRQLHRAAIQASLAPYGIEE